MHPFIFYLTKLCWWAPNQALFFPVLGAKTSQGQQRWPSGEWLNLVEGSRGMSNTGIHEQKKQFHDHMRSTMLLHCCVFLFHEQKQYVCVGLGSSSIAIWFIPRWCQTWGNLSSRWWSGETVDRRQCIGGVLNTLGKLKIQWWTLLRKWRRACFCMYHGYPLFPLFFGLGWGYY